MKITGIQAAKMEANGEGSLSQEGRAVVLRNHVGSELVRWWLKTEREAAQNLRMFRASLKYGAA